MSENVLGPPGAPTSAPEVTPAAGPRSGAASSPAVPQPAAAPTPVLSAGAPLAAQPLPGGGPGVPQVVSVPSVPGFRPQLVEGRLCLVSIAPSPSGQHQVLQLQVVPGAAPPGGLPGGGALPSPGAAQAAPPPQVVLAPAPAAGSRPAAAVAAPVAYQVGPGVTATAAPLLQRQLAGGAVLLATSAPGASSLMAPLGPLMPPSSSSGVSWGAGQPAAPDTLPRPPVEAAPGVAGGQGAAPPGPSQTSAAQQQQQQQQAAVGASLSQVKEEMGGEQGGAAGWKQPLQQRKRAADGDPGVEDGAGGRNSKRTAAGVSGGGGDALCPAPNSNTAAAAAKAAAGGATGGAGSAGGVTRGVGAYSAREMHLQRQEAAGQLRCEYCTNDGSPNSFKWLMGLKQVFSRQLPNMPKEYICRLLLDRRHRSVVLLGKAGEVLGGITYRVFYPQAFGEIAFCAVTANEQVKGFGTRLMNHTKAAARDRDGLTALLTYADNNAVGYFAKQGFSRELSTPREKWGGFIKDYDGGTLMEGLIHPKLPYTDLPGMLAVQKDYLDAQVRQYSNCHVVHPGLTHSRAPPPRGHSHPQLPDAPVPVPPGDIPGVREAGWSEEVHGSADMAGIRLVVRGRGPTAQAATPEVLREFMGEMLEALKSYDDAWPFLEPVNASQAVDYYDLVSDPVDLSLISARLASATYYATLDMFIADLTKMVNNCKYYNAPATPWYTCAHKVSQWVSQYLAGHVLVGAAPPPPAPRPAPSPVVPTAGEGEEATGAAAEGAAAAPSDTAGAVGVSTSVS